MTILELGALGELLGSIAVKVAHELLVTPKRKMIIGFAGNATLDRLNHVAIFLLAGVVHKMRIAFSVFHGFIRIQFAAVGERPG